jgi:hypothetical protein
MHLTPTAVHGLLSRRRGAGTRPFRAHPSSSCRGLQPCTALRKVSVPNWQRIQRLATGSRPISRVEGRVVCFTLTNKQSAVLTSFPAYSTLLLFFPLELLQRVRASYISLLRERFHPIRLRATAIVHRTSGGKRSSAWRDEPRRTRAIEKAEVSRQGNVNGLYRRVRPSTSEVCRISDRDGTGFEERVNIYYERNCSVWPRDL